MEECIINQREFTRFRDSLDAALELVVPLLSAVENPRDLEAGHTEQKDKSDLDVGDLIRLMGILRDLRDLGKEVSAATQNMYDGFSIAVVPLVMEEKGVETATANGYRLELMSQLRVSVPQEHKLGLHQWLCDHKLEGMISESVNSSSLKSMVKNAMEEGAEFPAHLLKIETYKQAKIVKK